MLASQEQLQFHQKRLLSHTIRPFSMSCVIGHRVPTDHLNLRSTATVLPNQGSLEYGRTGNLMRVKRFSGDAVRWRRPDPQTAPLSGHIPIGGLHLGVGHSNRCALAIISPSPVRISPIAHDFYNHVDFGAFRNEPRDATA